MLMLNYSVINAHTLISLVMIGIAKYARWKKRNADGWKKWRSAND